MDQGSLLARPSRFPSRPSSVLHLGCSWVWNKQQCHLWRALHVPPSEKAPAPTGGVRARTGVCVRACACLLIALPAMSCCGPGCPFLPAWAPRSQVSGSFSCTLQCPSSCSKLRDLPHPGNLDFCASPRARGVVIHACIRPSIGSPCAVSSLSSPGCTRESPAGREGVLLLPFSSPLAICCLLHRACGAHVCIKWMRAAIP